MEWTSALKLLVGDSRPTGQRREGVSRASPQLDVGNHDIARNNTNRLSYGKCCASSNAIPVRTAAAIEDVVGAVREQDLRA